MGFGVKEPEASHMDLLDRIVRSENPSAYGEFPGEVVIGRQYDRLVKLEDLPKLGTYVLRCPGETEIPELGIKVICAAPDAAGGIPVHAQGTMYLRSRETGDTIKLPGGTKSLKKLFIDEKIPARHRDRIPVIADDGGVLLVAGLKRCRECRDAPNWSVRIETM